MRTMLRTSSVFPWGTQLHAIFQKQATSETPILTPVGEAYIGEVVEDFFLMSCGRNGIDVVRAQMRRAFFPPIWEEKNSPKHIHLCGAVSPLAVRAEADYLLGYGRL